MTRQTFINSERGGPPKYRLTEICDMLGVELMAMIQLARHNDGFPLPALAHGFNKVSKHGKDHFQKSYYSKKEVIDWYKKVTAEAIK